MRVEYVSLLHGTLLWIAGGSKGNVSEKMNDTVCETEAGPRCFETLK